MLIYFGFALFGLNAFGATMEGYSTLNKACLTLTAIVFGQLDFEKYYEYDSVIGTTYFCLYVIVFVIILFNILSVVVTESYKSIKDYLSSDSQELNVVPDSIFIKRNFNQLVKIKLRYYEKDVKTILEGS